MPSYKDIFELASAQYEQEVDTSRALSDKARTYVTVIGIVFGYSILNIGAFLAVTEKLPATRVLWPDIAKSLFVLYLAGYGLALIFTLCSLRVRYFVSTPLLKEVAEFRSNGPGAEEAERAYHTLANLIAKANEDNRRLIQRQTWYLEWAITVLICGTLALILLGAVLISVLFV